MKGTMPGVTLIADCELKPGCKLGAQGHSGHGNFPRVIDCMASGMDMTPMSTKKVSLEELPETVLKLQADRSECKVTYIAK